MRLFPKLALVAAVLIFCLSSPVLAADEDVLTPEEMARVKVVLVPSPSELFVAVDKMGEYDWESVVTVNTNAAYNSDYLRALNLGVRTGDGFLAIQAEDGKMAGEIIRTIERLARDLAVDEPILAKGNEIQKMVMEKKWAKVRSQLDVLKNDVENYINNLGDEDNAVLVAAGGWLEGLRAVTKLLSVQYDPKASSILYQPGLVQYFSEKFGKMDMKNMKTPVVQEIADKLPEIKTLISVGHQQPIPKENIEKLNTIANDLILAIERG